MLVFTVCAGLVSFLLLVYILTSHFKKKSLSKISMPQEKLIASFAPGLEPRSESDGNFPDMAAAGSLHQFLVNLHQKFGPVASFWWGANRVVSIYKPEHFKQTVKIFDRPFALFELFAPFIGSSCIQYANGSDGQHRHKAYSRCYTEENIRNFYPTWNNIAQGVVDNLLQLPKGEHTNMREVTFAMAIKSMLILSFGEHFSDEKNINSLRNSYDIVWDDMEARLGGSFPEPNSDREKRFSSHSQIFRQNVQAAISYRRNNPSTDNMELFIDVLIKELDGRDDVMINDAVCTFVGGFHTTGLLMLWSLYFLAEQPAIQDKLRKEILQTVGQDQQVEPFHVQDISFINQILDETLRCSVLAPYAARVADHDLTIGGFTIPKQTPIVHALGMSLEDPQRWPNPEKFDPERFSAQNRGNIPKCGFEPFGFAGKRKCPAYRFGYHEAGVFLCHILRRLEVKLVPNQKMERKFGLVTTPAQEMWFTLEELKTI